VTTPKNGKGLTIAMTEGLAFVLTCPGIFGPIET
jgi:hypothetical protein